MFARVGATISRQPPGVDQAVLADFIREGHLDRHLRGVLRTYPVLPIERGGLVLGFSSYHPGQIRVAVRQLAGALKRL